MEVPTVFPDSHRQRKYQPRWICVGREVYVYWPLMRTWYKGVIEEVKNRDYVVAYPDGDSTRKHDAVRPALLIDQRVQWDHFSLRDEQQHRNYVQKAAGQPLIFDHSFVALHDRRGDVLAYVLRFLRNDDGIIDRFEGLWVYKLDEIANDAFVLASVYGRGDAGPPAVTIAGFNDDSYQRGVCLSSDGFTAPIDTIRRPLSIVPAPFYRDGVDDYHYQYIFDPWEVKLTPLEFDGVRLLHRYKNASSEMMHSFLQSERLRSRLAVCEQLRSIFHSASSHLQSRGTGKNITIKPFTFELLSSYDDTVLAKAQLDRGAGGSCRRLVFLLQVKDLAVDWGKDWWVLTRKRVANGDEVVLEGVTLTYDFKKPFELKCKITAAKKRGAAGGPEHWNSTAPAGGQSDPVRQRLAEAM